MKCANCKKPAKLACGGCRECPVLEGEVATARYCNVDCQKADWTRHKPTCLRLKDRQLLYRVASTAQQLWYISREHTWELVWYFFAIQSVDHCKDELQTYKLMHPESQTVEEAINVYVHSPRPRARNEPVIQFSAHLFQSKQDEAEALSYLGCNEAISWMTEFIERFLDFVEQTIKVEHHTKGEKLRMKFIPSQQKSELFSSIFPMYAGGRKPTHAALKVVLRSGEIFAVDLAGAQYGYYEPVLPWNEFQRTRVLDIISADPPEAPKGILYGEDYISHLHYWFSELSQDDTDDKDKYVEHNLKLISSRMLTWQSKNLSLKNIWRLPKTKFAIKQQALADYIHWSLSNTDEWRTAHGIELRKQYPEDWPWPTVN